MALIIAALFLIIFVANVTLGSITGDPLLGNVAEMCLLLVASIAFVAAILKKEAAENQNLNNDQ
ncbi:MAG: hypothetical protein AAF414_03605 [Pseudomonadota bacterium]